MTQEKKIEQKFAKALAATKMPPLDAVNPHFGSKYASLLSVLTTVKEAMNSVGLALSQSVSVDNSLEITNTIFDLEGGDYISYISKFPLPEVALRDVQKLGSCITYCRRYSLLCIFGLVGEPDDDGNGVPTSSGQPSDKPAAPTVKNQTNQNDTAITDAQKKKLFVMMKEAGLSKDEAREFYKWALPAETKEAASNLISNFYDFLKEFKERRAGSNNRDDCPF